MYCKVHLLVDGMTCIPQEAWLHPELRLHLPALERMARTLDEGKQSVELLIDSLDKPEIKALGWINKYTVRPGIYTMPFLTPEYCNKLRVEADEMHRVFGYAVNEYEDTPYQIPELVVARYCGNLHACLEVLFHRVYDVICRIQMGFVPTYLRTVQFAKYEPAEVGHGNWHIDEDSDITVVVSLNPEEFQGGGTDLRTGPLASIQVPALPKGHALLFNGKTTLHRGRAVTSGRRDLLVFWSETK